jgi:hypothetical protein
MNAFRPPPFYPLYITSTYLIKAPVRLLVIRARAQFSE